jgi:hypothetical protein
MPAIKTTTLLFYQALKIGVSHNHKKQKINKITLNDEMKILRLFEKLAWAGEGGEVDGGAKVQSNDTTTTTTTIEKHEATKTQKYDNNVHDTT